VKFTCCLFFMCSFASTIVAQDFPEQTPNFSSTLLGGLDETFGGQTIIETDTGYMLIELQAPNPDGLLRKFYEDATLARDEACLTPYYNDLQSTEVKFPSTTHQLDVHEDHPLRAFLEINPQPRQFNTYPSVVVSFENYHAFRPARPRVKVDTLKAANSPLVDDAPTLNGVFVPVKKQDGLAGRELVNIRLALPGVAGALLEEAEWCRNTPPVTEMVDLEIKINVSSTNFYTAMENLIQAHTFSGLYCQAPFAFTSQGIRHELKPNASLDIMFDTKLFKQVCTTQSERVCGHSWVLGVRVSKCFNVDVPHIYVEKMPPIDLKANIALEGDISYTVSGNGRYLPTYGDTINLEHLRTILTDLGVPYRDGWITDSDDGPSFTLSYRVGSLLKHDAQILAGVIKTEMKRRATGGQEQ
jgi:hypothetical protein